VRNRGDGSVEILAEGAADSVQALADWCRRGPSAAQVSAVDVAEEPPRADLVGFEMRF
jgi:acylphosphatase